MRQQFLKTFLFSLIFICLSNQKSFSRTFVSEVDRQVSLSNSVLEMKIDIVQGEFSIKDKKLDLIVFEKARFSADGWDSNNFNIQWHKKKIERNGKNGMVVELLLSTKEGKVLPEYKFAFTLLDDASWIEFRTGLKNTLSYDCRFMEGMLFSDARLFPEKILSDIRTLNGAAGYTNAEVCADSSRISENSMLLTGSVNGQRYSIVWGGLCYDSFYAVTKYNKENRTIELGMRDPVGRLVRQGQDWWASDSYYLGLGESNPFVALENYGTELREANHADPNLYDYPTLCGWAVGNLSKGEDINTSVALVDELDAANQSGLTKYTKVAIRLEPDFYCYKDGNTEQGWWDDAHWRQYGHLVRPYDTFEKWCKTIRDKNGIPFTYFQCSMPSDDFAKAHPEWMLRQDISKLHLFHRHHQPYVRYDYTNKEFQKHMKSVWSRLHKDGMGGIKFDYPETAWNPEGGFTDPLATTTSAYRTLFQLAREGLGTEGRLAERNLGESERPRLDVTAGIVDIQRTTWDTNKFIAQYISTCGLRWYKNRNVFNYYQDSKDLLPLTSEIRQSMLTMITLTSGMLELATSFKLITPEMIHDISRIYPMYNGKKSPRPVDAFTGVKDPMVYDLALTPDWHQVTFFNTLDTKKEVSVSLGNEMIYGGLNLNKEAEYYVYDFWNDKLVGKLKGDETLRTPLNSLACAVYSVKRVMKEPQLISTNRHLFQGWMDTKEITYKSNKLTGKSSVVGGEPFRMVVALNGKKDIKSALAEGVKISVKAHPAGDEYKIIELDSPETKEVCWQIQFN